MLWKTELYGKSCMNDWLSGRECDIDYETKHRQGVCGNIVFLCYGCMDMQK
jgi:hypothetical protein